MIFVSDRREEGASGKREGERERELCGMLAWRPTVDGLEIQGGSPDIRPVVWAKESSFLEFSNLEGHVKSHPPKRLTWRNTSKMAS